MNWVYTSARWLLGLCYLIFGINGFGPWIPVPELAPPAQTFLQALMDTGYMLPFWKITEIITGAFLLSNRFVLPAAIIAMPVSINIFAFHLFLDPGGLFIGVVVFACNGLILAQYRQQLGLLFQAPKPSPSA